MTLRPTGRLLHFFGTGVLAQILLSGANFIAGFVMIRYTSDIAYGQYVLAQSAVLLLISAQGAYLSGPVTALAPRKSPDARRLMIGSLSASQNYILQRAVLPLLLVPALGYLLRFWNLVTAIVAAITILAGWAALRREYPRAVMLIYSRPQSMVVADVVYVSVLLVGIAGAIFAGEAAGPAAVAALALAAWAGGTTARRLLAGDPGWVAGDARPYWLEIRHLGLWAVTGAMIYWLFAQSYNYVLATRLDLTAVTSVNVARLVLMPIFVFTYGVNSLLTASASNWLAEFGLPRMLRRLASVTAIISVIDLAYFALAWKLRNWLIGDLMHKTIGDQDRLLILWACVLLVFLPREALQAALYALRQLKSMTWVIGVSAAVSLSLMWFGISRWGAAAVLIGQVAGECVNIVGLIWLLWKQKDQKEQQ
jgi:O-antigen/teichoic acid export membrane protein